MQYAQCRQCKSEKVQVTRGRLAAHRNAQNNPCTGSHSVIPSGRVQTDDLIENLAGVDPSTTPAQDPKPDLGMTVMGSLDENAVPYPNSSRDPLPQDAADPDPAESIAETYVQFDGEDGEISLKVFVAEETEPRVVPPEDAARVCCERNADNSRICLRPKGAHEHEFTTAFKSRERVVTPEPPAAPEEVDYQLSDVLEAEEEDFPVMTSIGADPETAVPMDEILPAPDLDQMKPVPTKQREGDQRLPDGGQECVQDLIIAEMEASKKVGMERYGSVLKTFNGRRGYKDIAEEVRDLHVYLKALEREAEAVRETLVAAVTEAFVSDPRCRRLTPKMMAEIAVDRIMGWVAGNLGAE